MQMIYMLAGKLVRFYIVGKIRQHHPSGYLSISYTFTGTVKSDLSFKYSIMFYSTVDIWGVWTNKNFGRYCNCIDINHCLSCRYSWLQPEDLNFLQTFPMYSHYSYLMADWNQGKRCWLKSVLMWYVYMQRTCTDLAHLLERRKQHQILHQHNTFTRSL